MTKLTDISAGVQNLLARPRVRPVLIIFATTFSCLMIWFLRRPEQLRIPYIWGEEHLIINQWIEHGFWSAAFHEYQGYFLVPSSVVVAGVASLDFRHLPQIEYWFATILFVATLLLLLSPKSRIPLPWRCAMALLLTLAPMNPETFGVALYINWWTMLWPLIAVFWERNIWWLRVPVILLGGLSGLAGSVMIVLYGVAILVRRRLVDVVSAGLLGLTLGAQIWAYQQSSRAAAQSITPKAIVIQFFKNFGSYDFGWMNDATASFLAFFGLCFALFILYFGTRYFFVERGVYREEVLLVIVALGLYGLMSSAAVPLGTHPISAGPRYFFFPFALTAWTLFLLIMVTRVMYERAIAITLLAASTLTLAQGFSRGQFPMSWSHELARCAVHPEGFGISVYTDGTESLWEDKIQIPARLCRQLGYPKSGP